MAYWEGQCAKLLQWWVISNLRSGGVAHVVIATPIKMNTD